MNLDVLVHNSTGFIQVNLGNALPFITSLRPTAGVPYIYSLNYNFSTSTLTVFANGTNIGTFTRSSNILATVQAYLIALSSRDAFYYENVVYNNSLTTPQQQQIEGYLAWKWGLQSNLPANHPYVLFPPS